MEKLDLVKQHKAYYTAKATPAILEIEGPVSYLSIAGAGDPSGQAYADDLQALYATAYTIKMAAKKEGRDFAVPKLEGLWWFDESKYGNTTMTNAPQQIPRSEWSYRMLIRMPDFVTEADVLRARESVMIKKKILRATDVTLYSMNEGKVVQMLHVGPFAAEPETLAKMMELIQAKGFRKNGHHHEIYLSDFRKTPQEKLRTILREPVK